MFFTHAYIIYIYIYVCIYRKNEWIHFGSTFFCKDTHTTIYNNNNNTQKYMSWSLTSGKKIEYKKLKFKFFFFIKIRLHNITFACIIYNRIFIITYLCIHTFSLYHAIITFIAVTVHWLFYLSPSNFHLYTMNFSSNFHLYLCLFFFCNSTTVAKLRLASRMLIHFKKLDYQGAWPSL